MSERNLEIIREYRFDPKEVIKGLNGYYESDKCNSYITIRRNDVECPAYCTAALYLSALIEWLRVDHDIFYIPGLKLDQVEAARSAAKMCGLRAHIKDEISKRGLWCTADEDIPELVDTIFKSLDEYGERADENRKEVVKLSKENRELKEGVCEDIMDYIRQEASRNGFDLPEEIDGEPLTIKRVFHDLLELLRKRDTERIHTYDAFCDILEALGVSRSHTFNLDIHELKNKAIQRASVIKSEHDRCLEQLGKATADYQALSKENQELKDNQKSDINALIRDYCTKNDIIAPSRYLSDEACIEYLFSVMKLDQKDRSFAILQDLYRDIFRKQPDGLSVEDIANKILDRILSVNKWADSEIRNLRGQIDRLKDLINAMNEEVKDM